jgi:hypothetical protein
MGELIFTIMYGGSMIIFGVIAHFFLNRIEKERDEIEFTVNRKKG